MAIIYTLLIIVFFGDSLEAYHLVPPLFNWLTEPLIYILFVYSLFRKGIHRGFFDFSLLWQFVFLLISGVASALYNRNLGFESILGFRLILRYYIFYLAVINLDLKELQCRNIVNFLIFLFLLQIPTAVFKFAIFGQGEAAIGTYSVNEGSLSTMIPLIAIGYIASYYIYYKKAWLSLVCCVGFIAFSIVGGKRALIFILPVLAFFIIVLIFVTGEYKSAKIKISFVKISVLFPILIFFLIIAGLRYVPTLNPERKVGGSISFRHAINFAAEYTNNTVGKKYTGGRLSTTKRIFSVMKNDGFERFLLGFGPGSFTGSRFSVTKSKTLIMHKLHIIYGVTPLGYLQIEYGFLGVMIYFFVLSALLWKCIKYWRNETNRYWKSILLGSSCFAFTMILLWGCYHPPSMLGDTIPCIFFLMMALSYSHSRILFAEQRIL